jgi:hypothetical protein
MAVSTSYQPLVFSGNGSTTAFSLTWQFFDSDDLTVIAIDGDGVETVQTITTHYTVSGGTDANGLPATGTLTMVTAPASGTTLRVERNTDRLQSTTWTQSGPFQAKSVEAGLDRVTLIAQESGGGNSGLTPMIDGDALLLETSGATDYYDAGAYPIRSSATPSDGDDLVNKTYADTLIDQGLSILSDTQDEAATAVSAAASATSSASAASSAQSAAEAALDSFDDRYLGAKSSAPVLDNDGDALVAGQIYYDTVTNKLRVYSGVAWADTVSTSAITAGSTDTLTNKTINSDSNTLTIDLSEATVTGTSAEFDTALSDDTFLFRGDMLDEDDFATDSATNPPSQQSTKAYIASQILDEDDFATDSATQAPSQQSVDAYLTANVARGDAAQSLSTAYKAQARENIDAASVAAMAQQNILVNGCHQISQEHGDTAIAGITGGSDYITDQWQVSIVGAGVVTAERDQDGPDGIADSLKVTVTTADASLAAGDQIAVLQVLEQSRIRRLGLGTSGAVASTIGFWVKASTTGTITAFARNYTGSAIDYSWVQDFTIDSTNTWEFKTATIPSQTSGTWGAAVNGYAASFGVCFASGTDAQGTAGWQNANKFATSSTSNFLASTSTTFQITGAFWLPGDQAPSEAEAVLLQRQYDDELRTCERYFWSPGSAVSLRAGNTTGGGDVSQIVWLSSTMRTTPSVSGSFIYNINSSSASAATITDKYIRYGWSQSGSTTHSVITVTSPSYSARM